MFENAVGNVDRRLLLEVASHLNIHFKEGSIILKDKEMVLKSGKNLKPKIVNIDNMFGETKLDRKSMNNLARNLSLEIYTNNEKGLSTFINIDSAIKFSIGKSGINDTFSAHKNRDIVKFSTANELNVLGEQGIYFITTQTPGDVNKIKYHHFLTPIKIYNNSKNVFVHIVIREFPKDKTKGNDFYYHRIEKIDNKKGVSQVVPINNTGLQPVESTPFHDNNDITNS